MVVFRGWNRRIGRSLRIVIYLACALVAVPIILRTLGPGSNNENEENRPRPSPDEVEEVPDGANVVQSKHSGDKRDWHNYQQITDDLKRVGPGEQGVAFHLPPKADMKKKNELYRQNGFNGLVSDFIALNRSIKDIRHSGCKSRLYLEKLPSVSVILPFNEELPSTLLRSVYSIINRSPKELLKEIILADDFSSHDNLKGDLDAYLQTHFHGLVKVVRASKREGLIRTRLMGARAATGDVLIFLDSHSECSYNWLPPLLEPIALNYRTVVCPFVDVIDYETFEYRAQDEGARGAFDWELYYKRLSILPEDEKNMPEPFKSPVMAGGYFAISAKWFWEVGGYDEGLDIWGGEQYELSFKVWMCGGEMIDAPCSRVGHIYRKFAPFTNPGVGDFIGRNYKRVAVVWMDEYAEYIYKRRPHYRHLDPGDVSKQKALREQLKCKSFKWFMEKIAFDLVNKYPPVEPEDGANGEIRNVKANLCIDTRFKGQNERFELEPCVRDNPKVHSGQQNFVFTWHRDIRPQKENLCFDVSTSTNRAPVVLFACHNQKGNQEWVYRVRSKQLYHPVSELCMDCDPGNHEIFMQRCDADSQTQQWAVENVNQELLRRWGENNPEDD